MLKLYITSKIAVLFSNRVHVFTFRFDDRTAESIHSELINEPVQNASTGKSSEHKYHTLTKKFFPLIDAFQLIIAGTNCVKVEAQHISTCVIKFIEYQLQS